MAFFGKPTPKEPAIAMPAPIGPIKGLPPVVAINPPALSPGGLQGVLAGATGYKGNPPSPSGPASQNAAGASQQATNEVRRMPNARFRSFAERFVVTRSEGFSSDPAQMQEDIWKCILDAKIAYDKIKEVSRGVRDDGNEGGF